MRSSWSSSTARPLRLPELLRQPLLHEEGGLDDWQRLLAREGLAARRHLDFSRACSHGGLLVQAAVAGLGVGLVPFALAAEDLAQRRLLRADCAPLPSAYGYRLLLGAARRDAPAVAAFEAWLRAEFAQLTPAEPPRGTQAHTFAPKVEGGRSMVKRRGRR